MTTEVITWEEAKDEIISSEALHEKKVDELRKLARQRAKETGVSSVAVQSLVKPELIHFIETGEMPIEEANTEQPNNNHNNNSNGDLAAMIADSIQSYIKVPQQELDIEQVKDLITCEVDKIKNDFQNTLEGVISELKENEVKKIEVTLPDDKKIDVGRQHKLFEEMLNLVQSKLNIWLYGESGSGKTHLAESIAKALDLNFRAQSVTAQTTKSDLFGYMDANGKYVESGFYEIYKNGGVFCLDEVDNGNANVLNLLNAATSNGFAEFPCGRVQKHENARFIACANTIGDGANRQYIGRNALDAALKNRFVFVEMDTDWQLVKYIATEKWGDKGLEMYNKVQDLRETIKKLNLTNVIATSRTVFDGASMLSLDVNMDLVLDRVFFKGCDKNTKNYFKS